MANLYDSDFYQNQIAGSHASAKKIVPILCDCFAPKSALDVGCGLGAWLAEFQKLGISDIFGIDGGYIEQANLHIEKKYFQAIDLDKPFELGRKFDITISLEVAEHLPLESAPYFVESVGKTSDIIVFSAAIPSQGGTNHINEQWQDFWADIFAKQGFEVSTILRDYFWDFAEIESWYKQNLLLFVRDRQVLEALHDKIRDKKCLNVVHPDMWARKISNYEKRVQSLERYIDALKKERESPFKNLKFLVKSLLAIFLPKKLKQ